VLRVFVFKIRLSVLLLWYKAKFLLGKFETGITRKSNYKLFCPYLHKKLILA